MKEKELWNTGNLIGKFEEISKRLLIQRVRLSHVKKQSRTWISNKMENNRPLMMK